MIEIWKPIKGYENHYEVSSLGRVKSIDRFVKMKHGGIRFCKGIYKKSTPHYKNGYHSVLLKVNQIEKRCSLHRLVAEAFIPNSQCKAEVNHKNGNKNDNSINNLEWVTPLENTKHSIESGLTNNKKEIFLIKDCSILEFESMKMCADNLNISQSHLSKVVKRTSEYRGYLLCV